MFSTGEIKAHIVSERDVTPEELVAEADTMYRECKARGLVFSDDPAFLRASEELMGELRKKHPQFCKSYPIVLRYMAQMQEYSSKAFRLYLLKIKERPWKSKDEYLWSQADYVVLLYRHTSGKRKQHTNKTQIQILRNNVYKMLKNESDVFEANAKAIEQEVEQGEKIAKQNKDANLRAHFATYGEECVNISVRAEAEVPADRVVNVDELVGTAEAPPAGVSADDLLG